MQTPVRPYPVSKETNKRWATRRVHAGAGAHRPGGYHALAHGYHEFASACGHGRAGETGICRSWPDCHAVQGKLCSHNVEAKIPAKVVLYISRQRENYKNLICACKLKPHHC
jgi:hypothetical protein